jgi:hypothetical protein
VVLGERNVVIVGAAGLAKGGFTEGGARDNIRLSL